MYFRPSLGGIAYLEEPFHSIDEYDVRLVDYCLEQDASVLKFCKIFQVCTFKSIIFFKNYIFLNVFVCRILQIITYLL